MPVKVLHTPFEYKSSTRELFNEALEKKHGPDYSKILYIAPASWKIHEAQRVFHAVTGDCYIPPVMMTLPQFSKRLFSLYENRKIVPQALAPVILSKQFHKSLGYSCLIADFVHEMKQHYPTKNVAAITSGVKSLFDRRGIPEEVSSRTMEALTIMDRYTNLLENYTAADENDAMAMCPGIIRRQNIKYDCLIIEGFMELTPSEEAVMKALIENADDTVISIPYNPDYKYISNSYINSLNNNFIVNTVYLEHEKRHISLAHYPYPSVEDEIEGIARSIKNLFIAGTATDLEEVYVVFPELHARSDMISRVLKKYGIPFTLTSGKPLACTKPYLDLLALLDSVSNDYPRLQFSQFLISPYFKALPYSFREYIPSLCISSGFTKGRTEWLNLVKPSRNDSRREFISSTASQTLEKDLSWVFKKLTRLESICRNSTFSDYSEAVVKLLNDFDFDDNGNQPSNNKNKIIEIVNELSLADRFFNHAPTDFHSFTEALKHCLLNSPMPEPETTGVRILRFTDAYGLEPKHLYFGGLRDGDFPSKPDIDHLMPDSARKELGLVNMEKYLFLQKFQFRRLLSSAKNYYLSYSVTEGDRLFLPSSFLSWNEGITRTVYGIFSKEEELIRKSIALRSSIISDIHTTGKRIIRKMFGEESSIRVTDIDAYRTCARKFFIERVLSLKPLEIIQFEIEALTLGTIVHEIMQELLSEPFTDLSALILNAGRKIDALLSRKPLEEYWKRVLKDTFLSILPDIYAIEQKIADDGFVFMGAEVPVTGELLEGITLKGKIDRIDKKLDHGDVPLNSVSKNLSISSSPGSALFELIDYKTGATQFSGSQILSQGANLQLLLYAALMKLKGMPVGRVGIYSLKDLSLTWIPNRKDRKDGRTLEDYISVCLRFLKETVWGMRNGEFPARPLNDQTCRNCHERPYCPYIQKAAFC